MKAHGLFCLMLCAGLLSGCGQDSASTDGNNEVSDPGGLGSFFGSSSEDEAEGEEAPETGAVLKTGDVITNSIGMKLGVVPPGEFQMGSPETEEKRSGDERTHRVRLTKPIFMGVYEVTQAEFQQVMETNPSGITDSDRLPVQNVSWEQAIAFCNKLSELPEEKAAGRSYRLPTEAEWEYACRAGSRTPTAFGASISSTQANFDGNYPYGSTTTGTFIGKPQAVGSYEPNVWGMYDMHGNVWEWCNDWFGSDYYMTSASEDPQGPENGISHVIRGGSWYNFGYVLRSAYRSEFTPPLEANIYGFRVVAAFSPDDTFEASELDNPNPLPMTAPTMSTTSPTVASTSSTPMMSDMAVASASPTMTPPMGDDDPLAGTPAVESGSSSVEPADDPERNRRRGTPAASSAGRPVSTAQLLMLPVVAAVLLSLVDPARLNQGRHYDIAGLLLLSLGLALPWEMVRVVILGLVMLALAGRLVYAQRQESLPKAVVPRSREASLLVIASVTCVAVVLLHLAFGRGASGVVLLISAGSRVAVGAALVLIGQRWKNRTLGASLALVWLVLPLNDVSLAAALMVWAFVVLNRAPLSGVLFGAAIAMHWWLAFLVPLWVSYYRGKARTRFLTTAVTCGVVGLAVLTLLPGLVQTGNAGSLLAAVSAGELVVNAACIVALCGASGLAWFWPKTRSESTLTVMSTVLVACVFLCSRTDASLGIALPWLLLSLTGGCASRGPLVVPDGLVVPGFRRVMARFQMRTADGGAR